MKKIIVGATLLALLGSPAVAQTTSTRLDHSDRFDHLATPAGVRQRA